MSPDYKFNLRRKGKKRLPSMHPEKLAVLAAANTCGPTVFLSDVLMRGTRFCTFDMNREALAIENDISLQATRVARVVDQIAA